ncbi:hypothetical protein CBR_g74672 [Chara braunii]|uniref:Uncharacterized protein n=1 Tax=Chara braunii TaxID=69332 RepID=A0A388KAE4_CHABU|nr:hypothetical protein CBR_g74672 [Chara braunii]|eukprot:GBG66986.1 hypothetical protein CBR_g74672 [Chara braunii]
MQSRLVDPLNTVAGSSGKVLQVPNVASAAVHGVASTGEKGEKRGRARRQEGKSRRWTVLRWPPPPPTSFSQRLRQADDLDAKSKLWTDGKTFWGTEPGRLIAEVVHPCADYYCAIVDGDASANTLAGLIMLTNDVPRFRIEDPTQRDPTLRRARKTANVAMRVIHGWIFRSPSRVNGFARAESYVSVDYPTDLANTVWKSLEWSRVVSPSVVYHTLALKMDVPLWYVGAYIHDRPEGGDMAALQESTVLHLASCFQDAFGGQWSENGKMSQSKLNRIGDAFRLFLAANM